MLPQSGYPTTMQALFPGLFDDAVTWSDDAAPAFPVAALRRVKTNAARDYWLSSPPPAEPDGTSQDELDDRVAEGRAETAVAGGESNDTRPVVSAAPQRHKPRPPWRAVGIVLLVVALVTLAALMILDSLG